jgi:hypothetical protein
MPIATMAPRKPPAHAKGSHWEWKDDVRVIVHPPVYEKGNFGPRGAMHESFHTSHEVAAHLKDCPATKKQ